jgi:hypothetical protein
MCPMEEKKGQQEYQVGTSYYQDAGLKDTFWGGCRKGDSDTFVEHRHSPLPLPSEASYLERTIQACSLSAVRCEHCSRDDETLHICGITCSGRTVWRQCGLSSFKL